MPLPAHRRYDESIQIRNQSSGYNVLLDCLYYVVQGVAPDTDNAHEVAVQLYHTLDHRQILQLLQYRALPASMHCFDEERNKGLQTLQVYIARAEAVIMSKKNNASTAHADLAIL